MSNDMNQESSSMYTRRCQQGHGNDCESCQDDCKSAYQSSSSQYSL